MKKTLLISIVIAAFAPQCRAQRAAGNFTYKLPKTEVWLSLLVEKATFTPGKLSAYAGLYFKTEAGQAATEQYAIVDAAMWTEGIADDEREYEIMLDKKHSIISIDCGTDGTLHAINTTGEQATVRPVFVSSPRQKQPNPYDYMSQDILAAENMPMMARLVAQEIYDIRESRRELSRGEAEYMPKDGEQLRLMLAELDTQERALMRMFTGTTVRDTMEYRVHFVPQNDASEQMLFRFSKHYGIVAADDLSGSPYYAVTRADGTFAEATDEGDDVKRVKDDMVVTVCVPGRIEVTVSDGQRGSTPLCSLTTYAAQYGYGQELSGALFGKKFTSKIVLDGATGAVKSLTTEPLE